MCASSLPGILCAPAVVLFLDNVPPVNHHRPEQPIRIQLFPGSANLRLAARRFLRGARLPAKPEAFSRVLIDQALRESGWDLLDERLTSCASPGSDRDDRRVRFELDGHSGRADYVLSGERGPRDCPRADHRLFPRDRCHEPGPPGHS